MKTTLFESASFSDLNAERVRRSRMLPIILAFEKMMGKDKKITISLKNSRDYYSLWQQLIAAGHRISLKNPRNGQEMGPEKFAKSLELLGLEDPTDLQSFIEDYTYRKMLEDAGVKFSFSKDTRNNVILPSERTIKSNGKLSEVGITDEEGVTWEWGTTEDEDIMKQAPEGRDIWVIRTTHYGDGYPCMFLYPYEGSQISKYSTALDIFFMNKSKETGVIYDYYDPKKFNLLWVACPCTFDWFLEHPVPDPNAGRSSELEENMRAAEETDITSYESDDIDESLAADRKALNRLVKSYGKKDVLNFVRHLNEASKYMTPNLLICVDTSSSINFEAYSNYSINDILDICNIDYGASKPNAQVKIAAFADEGIYYMDDIKNMYSSILSNIPKKFLRLGGSDFKQLLTDISRSLPTNPYTEVIIITDRDIYAFEDTIEYWAEKYKHRFDTYIVMEYDGSMICANK